LTKHPEPEVVRQAHHPEQKKPALSAADGSKEGTENTEDRRKKKEMLNATRCTLYASRATSDEIFLPFSPIPTIIFFVLRLAIGGLVLRSNLRSSKGDGYNLFAE